MANEGSTIMSSSVSVEFHVLFYLNVDLDTTNFIKNNKKIIFVTLFTLLIL